MASIIQIGGKWRATVRLKQDGKLILNRTRTFPTKRAASEWAKLLEAEVAQRGPEAVSGAIKSQGYTVARLIQRYIEDFDKAPKRFGDTKLGALRILQDGPFGEIPATRLTAQDVMAWCRDRHETNGAGAATLYQYCTYLRLVLRMARPAWGMTTVTTQAVDDALPILARQGLAGQGQERDRRLREGEYERLLAKLTDYQNKPRSNTRHADVFEFAVVSALRRGEILRIRWSDIDNAKRTVIIRDRKDPKNKIGNDQEVPLLGAAWDIVQRQPKTDSEDRIFPFQEVTVSSGFARACEVLGILDLHFHDLRHEGTSRMFEAGYQIQEVAIVTGHRNWNQLRRYTQIRPESLHRGTQPTD